MSLIDMANAVGGIVCGHEDKDEGKIRKSQEEYAKMERVVRLCLRFLEDAHLKEWDWKYAASHGWLCDIDFKWFKKELTDEGIFINDYKKNWKKWKKEFDRKNSDDYDPISEYEIMANAAKVGKKK